ncbi:MAG: preprotein translocase subunit YajC [bacterium]|nr:preprotein translocase subunit YajC [Candidatus Minthenecus merdequi]
MNLIILQAAGSGASSWMNIGMIVLLFVIFYFFMIRPQSKRQKEIKKFQDSLANGKKVITQGGVYGIIRDVKETYVVVEISEGVKIRINKGMVFDSPEDAESK